MKQHLEDAQNAFTQEAIEQHLVLWQTARHLISTESDLAENRKRSTHLMRSHRRSLWRRFINLFTIFGSS